MSHWTTDSDRGETSETDGETGEKDGKNGLLGRRRFLQVAGAGLAASVGAVGSAAGASYETITVSSGETVNLSTSGRGGTIENVLFDISASGAVARVHLDSQDGVVRNVAWRGTQDVESYAVFEIRGSGDMLVENVYMGDGSNTGHSAGERDPTAIWAAPEASGTCTLRNVNVQSWGDNGMYLSSATDMVPTIEKCYAADNANAEYRVGTDGAVIRDSVARNAYARGVWAWGPATATVENCHVHAPNQSAFWAGEASHPDATINVRNTEWSGGVAQRHGSTVTFQSGNGRSPEDFYPEGCPTTAEEAASGATASGGGSSGTESGSTEDTGPFGNTLLVDSPDGGAVTEYEIVTTGPVARGDDLEDHDAITDNGDGTWTISGLCSDGWTDDYTFDGEVSDYSTSGGRLDILVNGELLNPTETSLDNTLVVNSPDGGAVTEYEIVTTGPVARGDDLEDHDAITDNGDGTWTISGLCSDGWTDTYTFAGEVSDYSTSGGRLDILVDGELINPVEASTLRVETPLGGEVVDYEITTTGEITAGRNAEWSDDVSENDDGTWTVEGVCSGGYADSFEFRGSLKNYATSGGRAAIVVDGETVKPMEAPASSLRIEVPDDAGVVSYEVTATGEIVPTETAEWSDTITDNGDGTYTLAGSTAGGYADGFSVHGEITDASADGPATFYVDGSEATF